MPPHDPHHHQRRQNSRLFRRLGQIKAEGSSRRFHPPPGVRPQRQGNGSTDHRRQNVSEAIFTAYITKYALTMGIVQKQVEGTPASGMVVTSGERYPAYFHGEGREWHRTREAAVKRANAMRDAKVASLRKQIARLETAAF